MANQKFTDLTAASSLADTDLVAVAVDIAGTPTSKKASISLLKTTIGVGLTLVTGTDAATTMATNSLYVTDMSAWATSDRNYTLPASPSAGDRVGIIVKAGNASYELVIKGNTSQTINGGSTASEWSRLFITGESVILEYVASNTWLVVQDDRIPMRGLMRLSTNAAAETAATWTQPTTKSGVWTADTNVGSICAVASDKISARRAADVSIRCSGYAVAAVTDQKYFGVQLCKNGTSTEIVSDVATSPKTASGIHPKAHVDNLTFALDDYIQFLFISEEGSRGLFSAAAPSYITHVSLREIL